MSLRDLFVTNIVIFINLVIYRILLIIRNEILLVFHVLNFVPEKHSRLPVFISFHSIHVQNTQKCLQLQSNPRKSGKFFSMNTKQYTVLKMIY